MSKDALPINQIITGDCLGVMKDWPEKSVHCVVTSPPYWGLRDYGVDGQLGLEKTPEEYVAKMVDVFREVKRVLRDDGTLWLNLGDSYWGGKGQSGHANADYQQARVDMGLSFNVPASHTGGQKRTRPQDGKHTILKPKDLCGMPWRIAFALQADGYYLRQDIIWAKPNPMPESCTDRCTKAHEYLFLLTKKPRYFYDAQAIAEPSVCAGDNRGQRTDNRRGTECNAMYGDTLTGETKNKRSVWTITTKAFPDAHFATFPPKLVEPCILAGTSAKGCCPECGGPWERVVEKERCNDKSQWPASWGNRGFKGEKHRGSHTLNETPSKTTGWRPTCKCSQSPGAAFPHNPIPCTVLDPFMGSGTVAMVAAKLGRDYIGVELNPDYAAMAESRADAAETGVPREEAKKGQGALFPVQSEAGQ